MIGTSVMKQLMYLLIITLLVNPETSWTFTIVSREIFLHFWAKMVSYKRDHWYFIIKSGVHRSTRVSLMVGKRQISMVVKRKYEQFAVSAMFHKKLSTKYFFTVYIIFYPWIDLKLIKTNWKLCTWGYFFIYFYLLIEADLSSVKFSRATVR